MTNTTAYPEVSGIRPPRSVPLIDCRQDSPTRSPKGEELMFGSELAIYQLGLRGMGGRYDSTPASLQGYSDARERADAARDYVKSVRSMLADAWKNWRRAAKNPAKKGEGGSCYSRPACVTLCNFGAAVVCDNRQMRTEGFRHLK